MNKAFRSAYEHAFPAVVETLTHQQKVTRLYRKSLKLAFHWAVQREVFMAEAQKIRDQFDANKNCSEKQAEYFVKKAEERIEEMYHPEPYIVPWMPGGTKFMRNPTPPPEIVYPKGEIPESAYTGTNTPMHLDSIPITFRPVKKD